MDGINEKQRTAPILLLDKIKGMTANRFLTIKIQKSLIGICYATFTFLSGFYHFYE